MFRKKILVIDDAELMLRMISDVLCDSGYDVITARCGSEGLQKVSEEKPDLVILDIVMPDINGFEVCKILRNDESNNLMPIIMLSSKDNEDDKLTGLELGADDYITKPFNSRELISRVKNILVRIDRNRSVNPLTGLKGNLEIQSEITKRIEAGKMFAFIYIDLDNFKAYNDVYGFVCGDRAIELTADIIKHNVHVYGNNDDFIGHIGGDDFVIITDTCKSDAIGAGVIKEFDAKVKSLYTEDDVKEGCITAVNRSGQSVTFPLMTISLAVLVNKNRAFLNHIDLAEAAAELKKTAKLISGSVYIKDT